MTHDPAWLTIARHHIGVAEIPGPRHSPVIAGWLHRLRAWWVDDETPWCGAFVAVCMEAAGMPLPKYWMRAKAWADYGVRLIAPRHGCIVVFERKGGGHVGFVVGMNKERRLLVLGGNQGDKVSVAAFDTSRVFAYVWPNADNIPPADQLAVLDARGVELSTNEA